MLHKQSYIFQSNLTVREKKKRKKAFLLFNTQVRILQLSPQTSVLGQTPAGVVFSSTAMVIPADALQTRLTRVRDGSATLRGKILGYGDRLVYLRK